MRASYCYLPILRARGGQFKAVAALSPEARSRLIPLFDVPAPVLKEGETLERYLEKRADGIHRCWGPETPVYVDVYDFPPDFLTESGSQPIEHLAKSMRARGTRPIPVSGTTSERSTDHLSAVRTIVRGTGDGVCLRLERDELSEPDLLRSSVASTLDVLAVDPESVDVVLDLRYVGKDNVDVLRATVLEAIRVIRNLGSFRNFAIAGGSVPEHLPKQDEGKVRREPRIEIQLWFDVIATLAGFTPAFGDFGIVSPFYVPPGRRVNTPSRVRYTTATDHVFFRAKRSDRGKLCQQLVASADFADPTFSVGDQNIALTANGLAGQGNPAIWVADDLSHHLVFVSAQVWQGIEIRRLQSHFAIPAPSHQPRLQNDMRLSGRPA